MDCRIIPVLEGKCELGIQTKKWRIVEGNTGEKIYITKEVNEKEIRKSLLEIKQKGIQSISVALAHSYTYFEHELVIGKIAEEIGNSF